MSSKNLPPLEVGQAYVAADFQRFEYCSERLSPPGTAATLRLHLSNGTTIDLPASDADMAHLAVVLAEAFGPAVLEHMRMRGWT